MGFAAAGVTAAHAVSIPLMEWGDSDLTEFLEYRGRRIAVMGEKGVEQSGGDPHTYLKQKLFRTLSVISQPNQFGRAFWAAGPERCVECFVWTDGYSSSSQMTPYNGTTPGDGQTWWPCIVHPCFPVDATTGVTAVAAFPSYCPALAAMGARPWGCDPSRRRLRGMVPPPPPLPPLAPPAAQLAADASSDDYVPDDSSYYSDAWEFVN